MAKATHTSIFSHLDKLYWKKEGISKGALIEYYTSIAPYILPYLKDRPLVLHRFLNGIEGESFYQKEAGSKLPSFVKTTTVHHKEKDVNYILVQNVKTLLYVVNLGSIEMNPLFSTYKSAKPDYMVLDLDPEAIAFNVVVDVANEIHALLAKARIDHFCKTSGGRGLHILVPLKAKYSYEQSKHLAFLIATIIHQRLPTITSLERSPKKRQKKVYLDYLQNNFGQTIICPYSVKAKPYAPVSTPLSWSEVKHGLSPLQFTLKNLPKRLAQKGDLLEGLLKKTIHLEAALNNLAKEEKIMPLVKGPKATTKEGISENIRREMKAKKPQKQAVAIALSQARKAGAKIPKKKRR